MAGWGPVDSMLQRLAASVASFSVVVVALSSCADGSGTSHTAHDPSNAAPSSVAAPTATTTRTAQPSSPVTPASTAEREEPAVAFERIKPGLVKCYEQGRVSTPTMLDGRLTINASVDASGRIGCVIPTDGFGLTQEVEDCMSAQLATTKLAELGSAWSIAVPIVVKAGSVQFAERKSQPALAIESVETHRMSDAFDVLEALVPELQECVRSVDRSGGSAVSEVIVGARVNTDGRTACALAAPRSGTLPTKVSECASALFMRTKFPPPKGGMGLILVPIMLTKR